MYMCVYIYIYNYVVSANISQCEHVTVLAELLLSSSCVAAFGRNRFRATERCNIYIYIYTHICIEREIHIYTYV